jgi:hypothetical protein
MDFFTRPLGPDGFAIVNEEGETVATVQHSLGRGYGGGDAAQQDAAEWKELRTQIYRGLR